MPAPADLEAAAVLDEVGCVVLHRFTEARQAGLTLVEARLFAESDTDVGLLRTLVNGDCPSKLIARILN